MCDRGSPDYNKLTVCYTHLLRSPARRTNTALTAQVPDRLATLGGWLFKKRTSIPLPIVLALLIIPAPSMAPLRATGLVASGAVIVALGELLRLWGVHHIGVISRTRSDRLGPLIDTGPFSLVRNPLYLGNILLWLGFALSARLVWLAPLVGLLLAFEYHAIVRWEERLLESRLGPAYLTYMQRVPRWVPLLGPPTALAGAARFSWGETFLSERGTLVAIAAGYALLVVKHRSGM
jgi:protein-S-isoprenylcysteine O-methyltransferase Ste14